MIEKLNDVSKSLPQPMGFRVTVLPSRPRMLLIAQAAPENLATAAGYAPLLDGLWLHGEDGIASPGVLPKTSGEMAGLAWGAYLDEAGQQDIAALAAAGCDVVVITPESSVAATYSTDKLGRVLRLEPSLGDDMLRTVNDLPVDAVLSGPPLLEGAISWRHLMTVQRLTNYLSKPLIVPAPLTLAENEVRAVWQAGADAIVVEIGAGDARARLEALRAGIDKLVNLPPRRRVKAEAFVPYVSRAAAPAGREEPEEPEEPEEE
ncbi:MAG: hypothetical protein HYX96_01035 [Chloroflexi bacterium]|nr:hypothetical protein [Chloroflexota bacterium]